MIMVEMITDRLIEEITPTLEIAKQELTGYADMALNPDWDRYKAMEALGMVVCIIARNTDTDKIEGYGFFFIQPNVHYKDYLYAFQDAIYFVPEKRASMLPAKFIKYTEEYLKWRGCEVIVHHTKPWNKFGTFLKKLGYSEAETTYHKRINNGH